MNPGEQKKITIILGKRAFSYFNVETQKWEMDTGVYQIEVASSSRDIRLTGSVQVQGSVCKNVDLRKLPAYYHPESYWPVSKEEFEFVLGHSVPEKRKIHPFTINSTLGEVQESFVGRMFMKMIKKNMEKQFGSTGNEGMEEFTRIIDAMLEDMPIRQLAMMSGGALTPQVMEGLVEMMNGHYIHGFRIMRKC